MAPLTSEQLTAIDTELNRSTLIIIVLLILRVPHYILEIITQLETYEVGAEANTIYPLIRRLEKQGLIDFTLQLDKNRAKKCYQITEKGTEYLEDLVRLWRKRVDLMNDLLNQKEGET